MTKFSMFVKANARYAPKTMRYLGLAFFGLARKVGSKRFLQTVMADSPADLRAIANDEIMTALIKGSEIALAPDFSAHEIWATEMVANFGQDWTGLLADCRVPITLVMGQEDPFSPPETAREVAAAMPHIRLIELPDTGQLIFAHCDLLFDLVQAGMSRPSKEKLKAL